ncbi:MAG: SpoVK/Ycf46/Vps4 family AAA+-type ATPase [Bacillariaceae sp.]|jgi:SpoVK/Ycf46/Vps4 family AAA+-type ATPase
MIRDDGWLELVEVSSISSNGRATTEQHLNEILVDDLSFPDIISENESESEIALHLFFSRDDHDDDDGNDDNNNNNNNNNNNITSLTSVIVQFSVLPNFIMNEDIGDDYESSSILLRLHPVLFFFLHHATTQTNGSKSNKHPEDADDDVSSSPLYVVTSPTRDNGGIRVQIAPLPILGFQSFQLTKEEEKEQQLQNQMEQQYSWKIRPVIIQELEKDSHIFVSCVYVEDDELQIEKKIDETTTSTTRNNHKPMIDQAIGIALEGRIIKAGSVLLLTTIYGYVIANVTDITSFLSTTDDGLIEESTTTEQNRDRNRITTTYRLSDNVLDDYHCHIEVPPIICVENESNVQSYRSTPWEQDIPGYETLLRELINIFRIHGDPAAASGVILAGCAGIGKTRLASCVAQHYSSLNHKVYYLSIQDLIFQASVEANILENILVPKLRGCILWIVDDLNLLEIEEGSGDEVRHDVETVMVQNALVEAIDRFHPHCCILGIAQSDSNLPSELTKPGRFEKTVQMLQPTQVQRIEIWKNVLANDGISNSSSVNTDEWVVSLASSTAGFVSRDLIRVYRDAKTRCWARQQREDSKAVSVLLEKQDLREAIKSAIPSQLSELDVIKPAIFDHGLSWKEIYYSSWQELGGYSLVKKCVFRQVVAPWRSFLQKLDESLTGEIDKIEKDWLKPPPGVLFHGKSGTGKTKSAMCLAASLELPIIQVRAADLLDKWLGGSESLLRSLFARARTASPCILFLDEIDSIACNREEGDNNDVSSRILSTLLNEMDGVSSDIQKSRVLVIACTNRIESIDTALLRPGRLQEHFHMDNPDVNDLEEILRLRMDKIPMNRNFSLEDLASALFECRATGADVEGLCREAVFIAMRRVDLCDDDVSVSKEDFDFAIRERFGA